MRAPLEWLCEFLGESIEAELLAEKLTLSGLEVEAIDETEGGPVLDVAITPNRADCLSIRGLANECAAILGLKSTPRRQTPVRSRAGDAQVTVRERELCTRYCGQLMEQVVVAESPQWMQRRLTACGIRSINNVVDATNYVLLELGQPLHAFDYDRLSGGQIIVRRAKINEKLLTLDGKERQLAREDLVITDRERVVALAGVMGGQESEVHESTKRLFLESAYFDPASIRRTSRRLGLQTESSYRFERGVDWYQVGLALERLQQVLIEIAGARPEGKTTDVISERPKTVKIKFAPARVEKILGRRFRQGELTAPLKRIGCTVKKRSAQQLEVDIPASRRDLEEEVDLIEEIARLNGYEAVPEEAPRRPIRKPLESAGHRLQQRIKTHLASLGFNETIHYSFCSEEDLTRLGSSWQSHAVKLANPLSQEAAYLRPSLIPSLLNTVQYHHYRQMTNLRFFELRSTFMERGGSLVERVKLAGVLSGAAQPLHWSRREEPVNFYEAKGIVESLAARLGLHKMQWEAVPDKDPHETIFHPGHSTVLRSHEQDLGVVGRLHPELEAAYELKGELCLFELDWPLLVELSAGTPVFKAYSVYPRIERDLALVVDEGVRAQELIDVIRAQGAGLIREVRIFDLYRGPQVPEGKKSLAIAYQIGREDRTLQEAEVQVLQDKIVAELKKKLQVGIR